ncbi:PIR protein CIR protein [Plasmodium vinckei vinckei]|uniref:PIR protein CIR protein n=1 Tax=Plasmodium vinckei vinckei TaxID=54757 RepID=A0A449BMU2_PLAVN|nr:PIR protein CIR protein [Plasmodium vinckei vinckei]VEV54719.1 PIR protein CIR protein [Plasmodium vinckei vinckei]
MEVKELCEKFIAADKIINGENNGNLTMWDMINDPEFKTYCDSSKCRTTKEKIGGLSAYLFMKERVLATREIGTSGLYDEYFLMWLSDKLYKIAHDEGKSQINDITLNSAYEQYLKKNIVNSNHLDLLDKLNGLEEVNLMHMKHFYKLLNDICKVIAYYNPNDKDNNKLISNSAECYNQYSSLYDSVPKCNSYLHLLDNLKKTYYNFIDSVINENNKKPDLAWDLKTLKTSDGKDNYFAKGFTTFDFNSSE